MAQKIFRFKFRQEFLEGLIEFARIHQFDETTTFKEAFETFCDVNKELISNETNYLNNMGYNGNIINKMYTSVRYYFKNKNYTPQETKTRRKYIQQDKDFIVSIDENVMKSIRIKEKPAKSYEEFVKNEVNIINNEKERLKEFLNTDEEIEGKLKKTYKNRYFIQQKNFDDV